MLEGFGRLAPAAVMLLAHLKVAGALVSPLSFPGLSRPRASAGERMNRTADPWGHQRHRRQRCTFTGDLHHRRRRTRAPPLAMVFKKRPEERALGDVLIPEETPGTGDGGGIGISAEPPGFLKRLFSVPKNVRKTAKAGDVVVPVIGARDGWGGIRQRLANQGIYPGIEYRILEVSVYPTAFEPLPVAYDASAATPATSSASSEAPATDSSLPSQPDPDAALPLASARDASPESFDDGRLVFTVRPIYPLVKRLEREDWPVRVAAREFPVMLTPFSYNAATAWAALTTSLSLLTVGFVLSQAFTLSVINSHSMEPTLQVGDVVLVEKFSRSALVRPDDIVYFRPPPVLREVVSRAGGTLSGSDLFVKRVAALPGDEVTVSADGSVDVRPAKAGVKTQGGGGTGDGRAKVPLPTSVLQRISRLDEKVLPPRTVFVLGDNPAASMDSRVWGELDEREIVGHALLRVLPPRSFGLLK
ncbi:unnamed protein product [Scytosiphon promiscuus]